MAFISRACWSADFAWNGAVQLSFADAVGLSDSAETDVRRPMP